MSDESVLGDDWPRLHDVVDDWFQQNADQLRETFGHPIDDATLLSFELGFYLRPLGDPNEVRYEATPNLSWIFGHTGGDGEHLCVLTHGHHQGVIVLAVPMAFDTPNLVVGQNLHEFLAILCTVGITNLMEICYRGGLDQFDGPLRPRVGPIHRHLQEGLDLDDIGDPLGRLHELANRFGPPTR